VNRLFTKKKGLKTNRKDALHAERKRNNRLETIAETVEIDTNNKVHFSKKVDITIHFLFFIQLESGGYYR